MTHPLGQLPNDDGDRCWASVRQETGFDTYQQYLNEYCDGEPRLTRFFHDGSNVPRAIHGNCLLYDLSEDGSLSCSLNVAYDDLSAKFTELLIALRNPPPTSLLRVLLLEPRIMEQKLPIDLINVIGLGLRVTPDIFKAYLSRNQAPLDFTVEVPLRASYGAVGRTAVMVSRNYLPENSSCPAVVLLMGHPAPPDNYRGLPPSKQTDPLAFAQPVTVRPQGLVKYPWPWIFERLFNVNMQLYHRGSLSRDDALVFILLPVLDICVQRLERASVEGRDKYRQRFGCSSIENEALDIWQIAQEDRDHEMEQVRFRLGRWIRHYILCENDCMRYLRAQGIRNIQSYEALTVIREEASECLADARALETQIHDWLQLRVSSLALQESKKSIEISNLQIAESQRVKIVTVLAFVYVPLNLATSIFGMNLQQLNRNGQHIWAFVVTAVLALLITFLIWFMVEQRVGYIRWCEQMDVYTHHEEQWPEKGMTYNFVTRFRILTILMQEGLHRWAWESGNWLRILINQPAKADLALNVLHGMRVPRSHRLLVCDYVCMNLKYRHRNDAFTHKRHEKYG